MNHDDSKYYFDEDAAQLAVDFFQEVLVLTKGRWAGKPFILMDWELKIIRDVFGWKRKSDGLRRYRTVYIEVPKKNGKSPLAAGVALYMLFADREFGAEVYSFAADRKQAKIVYDLAKNMVKLSPPLLSRSEPMEKSIFLPATLSKYEALSHEAGTVDGIDSNCIVVDELHRHKTRKLYDVIDASTAAREQPLTFNITTAGDDKTTVCWEVHEKAERVLSGKQEDDTFYAVIYAAGKDDDWTDPATWRKANPSLGVTVSEEYIAAKCEDAKRTPGKKNAFLRYHLNLWVESATPWIDIDYWDMCGDDNLTPDIIPENSICIKGVDLASTGDLCADVSLFLPVESGDAWWMTCRFYMPEDKIKQNEEDVGAPFSEWVDQGYIIATPGDMTDYDFIRANILEDSKRYTVKEIAIDPFGAAYLMTQLQNDGLEIIKYSNSYTNMTPPMRELESLIPGGKSDEALSAWRRGEKPEYDSKLWHDNNPVMRWMMTNVIVKTDPDLRTRMVRDAKKKIDGPVSLAMAMGRAIVQEDNDPGPSVYATRGIISL